MGRAQLHITHVYNILYIVNYNRYIGNSMIMWLWQKYRLFISHAMNSDRSW